jgi:hypothetical protein
LEFEDNKKGRDRATRRRSSPLLSTATNALIAGVLFIP